MPICWADLSELQDLPDVGEASGLHPTRWASASDQSVYGVRRGERDDQWEGAYSSQDFPKSCGTLLMEDVNRDPPKLWTQKRGSHLRGFRDLFRDEGLLGIAMRSTVFHLPTFPK